MEKIIKEFLTPIIEKELHLKQVSDYVWADNYNDLGMRKVLSLYFINNFYATLKWGWNFEFIPKSVGSKLVWAKTDKSIYTHIFEFSEAFYNSDYTDNKKKEAYEKTIVWMFWISYVYGAKKIEKNINICSGVTFNFHVKESLRHFRQREAWICFLFQREYFRIIFKKRNIP